MSLIQESKELARLQNEVEGFFNRTFGGFPLLGTTWAPSVDVKDVNGNLIVKADLPGVKRENVEITATDHSLTIEGSTSEELEEKKANYYRQERRSGQFVRVIPLPATVDVNKTEAKFEDGTVTITLPKVAEAQPQGKKIEVS
jgi:HSP20 family protein